MDAFDFHTLEGKLPPIIARKRVAHYFGGLISPKTLANADSAGTGPRERIKLGRDVAYPTPVLLDWLANNSRILKEEGRV